MNARFICEISHNLSRVIDFLKHPCNQVAKYLTNCPQYYCYVFCHSSKTPCGDFYKNKYLGENNVQGSWAKSAHDRFWRKKMEFPPSV